MRFDKIFDLTAAVYFNFYNTCPAGIAAVVQLDISTINILLAEKSTATVSSTSSFQHKRRIQPTVRTIDLEPLAVTAKKTVLDAAS